MSSAWLCWKILEKPMNCPKSQALTCFFANFLKLLKHRTKLISVPEEETEQCGPLA